MGGGEGERELQKWRVRWKERERKGGREAGIGRGGKSSKGDGKERRRGRSKR